MNIQTRNGRYLARYVGPDGRQISKTFDRKYDARQWATAAEADMIRGEWVDPRNRKVTFAERAEHWQATANHRRNTAEAVERRMRLHILPRWGKTPVASIQRSEVQKWITDLRGEMSAGTVHVVFAHFRSVMIQAEDDRLLSHNPTRRITLPKKPKRDVVPFDDSQIDAMLDAAGPRWRGILAFAIGSGLRSSELRAVSSLPTSLDWVGRRVHVRRQWDQANRVMVNELKTEAGKRTVPLADWVMFELAAHCERNGIEAGDLLFPSGTGEPVRSGQLAHLMAKVTKAAKVERLDGESVHFHDCRHTYASSLIRANLNPKQIQKYLGHASIEETFDTYGHLYPDDEEGAREAQNRLRPSEPWTIRGLSVV